MVVAMCDNVETMHGLCQLLTAPEILSEIALCPGNYMFAVCQASLIFQKRFQDAVAVYEGY